MTLPLTIGAETHPPGLGPEPVAKAGQGNGVAPAVDAPGTRPEVLYRGYAQQWLDWQCGMIAGVRGGGVFLSDRSAAGSLHENATWSAEDGSSDPGALRAVAAETVLGRRATMQKRRCEGAGLDSICDFLGYPLFIGEELAGAVVLITEVRAEAHRRTVLQLVRWGISWLETLLNEEAVRQRGRLSILEGAVSQVLRPGPLAVTGSGLCSELAERFRCDRVALGLLKGLQVSVAAMSHQLHFDGRVAHVRALEAAMDEAADHDTVIIYPCEQDQPGPPIKAHEQLSRRYDDTALCSVPLREGTRTVGLLTLVRKGSEPWTSADAEVVSGIAAHLGPLVALKQRDGRPWYRVMGESLSVLRQRLAGRGHLGFKVFVGAALALVAALSLIQTDHRVMARGSVEGAMQRAVVAPQDGYVAVSRRRAGDEVKAGDVLAELTTRDLEVERERWLSEREKHAREYQEALATRDRARSRILAARVEQAEARMRLVEQQIQRTRLQAPFDGIVVSGDLSQVVGAPVARGDVLFELAPLEGYRVALEVDEHDIAWVEAGHEGTLRLAGFPDRTFRMVVERISPLAESRQNGSVFRAEARVVDDGSRLRPGMEGVGKVVVGRGSLLWVWSHSLLDRLRLWAWSLGG